MSKAVTVGEKSVKITFTQKHSGQLTLSLFFVYKEISINFLNPLESHKQNHLHQEA